MAYNKTLWVNNNAPPISAEQLNKIEQGIYDAHESIAEHAGRTDNPHNTTAAQSAYTSGVSGFSPNTVKAALDALAGVRIVEKGSNANGEYVRWDNGLQMCWRRRVPLTLDQWTSVVLPAAFVDVSYAVVCSTESGDIDRSTVVYGPDDMRRTISTIGLYMKDISINPGYADYMAIGRWK